MFILYVFVEIALSPIFKSQLVHRIVFESSMNIFHMLPHVRLTRRFVMPESKHPFWGEEIPWMNVAPWSYKWVDRIGLGIGTYV